MPELPDIELYLHALRPRVVGRRLERVTILGPSLLRSVEPPIDALEGRTVQGVSRLGKRIVFDFGDEHFAVIHLMIAGRLRWSEGPGERDKITQARFRFENGTLTLTEASTQKRGTLTVVRGREALAQHDPGGIDPLRCALEQFIAALRGQNRTLKRALTDPKTFSGIGNAYSDEILHRAKLSPIALTSKLTDAEVATLHEAVGTVLAEWRDRLIAQSGDRFPGAGEVTAFRPEMAVHGKFGKPCPVCGAKVARIVRADNEINYCPRCQTGGRVLADRALSRLLKEDWPREVEDAS